MENKISAFIIAYKEEALIGRCLDSLQGVVDQIIVIHDGPCPDNTLKIALKYTTDIMETEVNKGIGESHYITALKMAKYPWILRIDADEYLDASLRRNIKKLTSNVKVSAYAFIWPVWNGNKYISEGWPYKNFLFQKSKIGFIDLFHHPIIVYGLVKKEKYIVHHKPLYNNYTASTFSTKTLKWCKKQAHDHFTPLVQKNTYNVNITDIEKERKLKDMVYKYPILSFFIGYLIILIDSIKQPWIIFQQGFWFTAMISARYSYEVAKEVKRVKNLGL